MRKCWKFKCNLRLSNARVLLNSILKKTIENWLRYHVLDERFFLWWVCCNSDDLKRVFSWDFQTHHLELVEVSSAFKLLASNLISSRERFDLRNFRLDYQLDAQTTMLNRQSSLKEFARKLYVIKKFATRFCLICDVERVTLKFAFDMRVVLQSHKIHDIDSRDWKSSHENEFNCLKRF